MAPLVLEPLVESPVPLPDEALTPDVPLPDEALTPDVPLADEALTPDVPLPEGPAALEDGVPDEPLPVPSPRLPDDAGPCAVEAHAVVIDTTSQAIPIRRESMVIGPAVIKGLASSSRA
jgi:hypothetical protein